MSLESELSLSQNGGVHYECTRVRPTDDPVLFIGLGGTGVNALLCVKNAVQTRMVLPRGDDGRVLKTAPNNFGFLAVDTDDRILNKTCGVAGFDCGGDEFLSISIHGRDNIEDILRNHASEAEWSWIDKDLVTFGANCIEPSRQIGRFCIFWNAKKVIERLKMTVKRLLDETKGSFQNLRVFILTGIAGATGSGIFLDIAYLIRSVAETFTSNVRIYGFVFTPDLNKGNGGDVASMYRNGFAALKELDYWMSTGEHQQPFDQAYPGGYAIHSVDKPFDFCHIITALDANHHLRSCYEVLDTVAEVLFSYVVNEENLRDTDPPVLNTLYDHLPAHIEFAMSEAPYPANYRYLSVGSDRLEIPYTEITTLLAARVFEKLSPVFRREVTRESFEYDLAHLKLGYGDIKGFLCSNVAMMPIAGKKFGYDDIWPNNGPYMMVHSWLNSHAQQQVRKNQSNFVPYAEGILRPYLNDLIRSEERGPCYAARMIYSNTGFNLVNTLRGYARDCRERMSEGRRSELKTALDNAFAYGRNIPGIRMAARQKAVKEYMEALSACIDYEYMYWVYDDMAKALDAYANRLELYYEKVFKRLQDSLMILPGVFQENVAQIVAQENAAQKSPEAYARYLIRPMQFEREYGAELEKKAKKASGAFLEALSRNLRKFVGVSMDEIDQTVTEATDIGGFIAGFVNEMFGDTLTMNIETLLAKRIPAGTTAESYYEDLLRGLRAGAVPMYHTDVAYANLNKKDFSLVSIPDDCPNIYVATVGFVSKGESPKSSAERSKIQWVKIQAGMPLFAFPEVAEMEKEYEKAMKVSVATRRGVHLRWEWREQLPSPLPEATWPVYRRKIYLVKTH